MNSNADGGAVVDCDKDSVVGISIPHETHLNFRRNYHINDGKRWRETTNYGIDEQGTNDSIAEYGSL